VNVRPIPRGFLAAAALALLLLLTGTVFAIAHGSDRGALIMLAVIAGVVALNALLVFLTWLILYAGKGGVPLRSYIAILLGTRHER